MKHNRKESVLYELFKRNCEFGHLVEFINRLSFTMETRPCTVCKTRELKYKYILAFQVSN